VSSSNEAYIVITHQALENLTNEILEERNEEVAQLQLEYNGMDDSPEKIELGEKIEEKSSSGYLEQGNIMRIALKELGGEKLTDELIDAYRQEYDPYAWVVSFAPFEDPEICIAVMIPQGGHSYYAAPMVRDLFAEYFGLEQEVME
jgi:penicillin-binding protein 2